MKKILLLLLLLVVVSACESSITTDAVADVQGAEVACLSYTTDYIKAKCVATTAVDLSLCADVSHSLHREDCVLLVAELIQDGSQLADCSIAENEVNQIMCKALIKEDVDYCFNIAEGEGNDLALRNCIDLVSRKTRDFDSCEYYRSHSQQIYDTCGHTQDCENRWQEPLMMQENIDGCKAAIQAELNYLEANS
ncbi:MAG: hypothetical protein ABIJ18_01170 [archaeon]